MKNLTLKFYKIFLILIFFIFSRPAFCYETVIIDFPEKEGWHLVYSKKTENETIVQFMPRGETKQNWTRTVVFHSYPKLTNRNVTALQLQKRIVNKVANKNNTLRYKSVKSDNNETIGYWCAKKNEYMSGQCEILRTVQGYETIVSMHYINKNIDDIKNIEKKWIKIFQDVKNYYSYYRMDRMLNRATIFEF